MKRICPNCGAEIGQCHACSKPKEEVLDIIEKKHKIIPRKFTKEECEALDKKSDIEWTEEFEDELYYIEDSDIMTLYKENLSGLLQYYIGNTQEKVKIKVREGKIVIEKVDNET